MPYLDVVPEDINQEAGKKAFDTVSEQTGGRTRQPDSPDLWDIWFRVYSQNGGKVRIIEESGTKYSMKLGCDASKVAERLKVPVKPRVIPPLTLKIVELEFLSDHGVLKDNDANWKNTGTTYTKPDWTSAKSNIVSHNMNARARIRVVVQAEGEAPDTGKITAKVGSKEIFASAVSTFSIGRNEFTLTSTEDISDKIIHTNLVLKWSAATGRDPGPTAIGDTQNYILITFSTPVSRPTEPDDGFTVRRMKRSIDFIRKTGETDPHKIVEKLMGAFDSYTLTPNSAVPAELGHPQYTNAEIGAWALADYAQHTAECQAICRFVRGILEQVGCPGTVEPTVVWEDPVANAVKEAVYGASGSGLRFVTKKVSKEVEVIEMVKVTEPLGPIDRIMGKTPIVKMVPTPRRVTKTETWNAFLTTGAARVGENANGSGLNLYEACLKFTHSGKVRYYGGGAGSFASKEAVVRAFHSLIWICREENPSDREGPLIPICREIVKSY